MPDFPILDAPRDYANREYSRSIIDVYPPAEPYIGEVDGWVTMPLRLVHDQASGYHIELGPYSLSRSDIDRLRAAIRGYDEATGGPLGVVLDGC